MTNPYENRDGSQFWNTGVAKQDFLRPIHNLYRKKYPLATDMRIATAGSCFAQHIGRHLKQRGFNLLDVEPAPRGLQPEDQPRFGYSIYSARFGNIYTARQLLQLAKEAFGLFTPQHSVWINTEGERPKYFDAFRPNIEPEGFDSAEEVIFARQFHLQQVRDLLRSLDVLIFTFGLTECWLDKATGTIFPSAPGVIAGSYSAARYEFKNFGFKEIHDDMLEFMALLQQENPHTVRYLFTVSPVPLTATAAEQHVLSASSYSKSVLRAVCGQLQQDHSNVDYFPSYEIITNPWSGIDCYLPNRRTVKDSAVDIVMQNFFMQHASPAAAPIPTGSCQPALPDALAAVPDVICEDVILEYLNRH